MKTKPIPVRFSLELVERADVLSETLTIRALGACVSRSEVLRLATERGLLSMELEYSSPSLRHRRR